MCAYKEQFSGASRQNIVSYFPNLWEKPVSWHCVGDILIEKE
jgi:hypothetical protein